MPKSEECGVGHSPNATDFATRRAGLLLRVSAFDCAPLDRRTKAQSMAFYLKGQYRYYTCSRRDLCEGRMSCSSTEYPSSFRIFSDAQRSRFPTSMTSFPHPLHQLAPLSSSQITMSSAIPSTDEFVNYIMKDSTGQGRKAVSFIESLKSVRSHRLRYFQEPRPDAKMIRTAIEHAIDKYKALSGAVDARTASVNGFANETAELQPSGEGGNYDGSGGWYLTTFTD
ncbi:uncharacterized protein MKK02DRAFT_31379 [Dioszegia hungarica]|uniref:Uncharacterized protein n=1 Tax=Dioszegia hungarica TaxID=4972 RepID=A0AA38HAN7_9TREE|nr:uncharacterized protein MKK02DRAFT_31379 [Dioszegia hungarica]KAI9637817.1 hypothetical protein MKK02DRAFT_31379 [Dioszegia hungarica]